MLAELGARRFEGGQHAAGIDALLGVLAGDVLLRHA